MSVDFVYLASGSPRRRELLAQIGVPFRVLEVAIDEQVIPREPPCAYVLRLALQKAQAGRETLLDRGSAPVLAADTAVVLDGRAMVKPADAADAERMLREMSGRTHEVLTAVALSNGGETQSRLSRSEVTFRPLTHAEIEAYWRTGEPVDKAGGYAIQGRAAVFIADLRGSYSGVMGLPLFETSQLLAWAGVPRWQAR